MNARLARLLQRDGESRVWPLTGMAIVFLRQMRSRNAWRDLLIKRPDDTDWCLADDLRRRMTK